MKTCIYRGEATGDKVLCQSCCGKVMLRLFVCEKHGTCTQGRAVPDIACCRKCNDYTPHESPTDEAVRVQ